MNFLESICWTSVSDPALSYDNWKDFFINLFIDIILALLFGFGIILYAIYKC